MKFMSVTTSTGETLVNALHVSNVFSSQHGRDVTTIVMHNGVRLDVKEKFKDIKEQLKGGV